jgi:hypothetical protein
VILITLLIYGKCSSFSPLTPALFPRWVERE